MLHGVVRDGDVSFVQGSASGGSRDGVTLEAGGRFPFSSNWANSVADRLLNKRVTRNVIEALTGRLLMSKIGATTGFTVITNVGRRMLASSDDAELGVIVNPCDTASRHGELPRIPRVFDTSNVESMAGTSSTHGEENDW